MTELHLLDELTGGGLVAYFSMEIALEADMPTYSGGLGVLAGDTIRAAADLRVPMLAVSLLYHKGFFKQGLGSHGEQLEEQVTWDPRKYTEPTGVFSEITIEGRKVRFTAHRYTVRGATGAVVPVYFLDADLKENSEFDRSLTDSLYAGDERYRLGQEALLGIGGVALLKAMGHGPAGSSMEATIAASGTKPKTQAITRYHMNEGHAALLTLGLVAECAPDNAWARLRASDLDWLRDRCVFTTHTPVPAGHDRFPISLVGEMLGATAAGALEAWGVMEHGQLNMTLLAMEFSRYINGVAKRHGEVSRDMFKSAKQTRRCPIKAITNGVHGVSWTSKPMQNLFDETVPGWRADNSYLRYVRDVDGTAVRKAHDAAKHQLIEAVKQRTGVILQPDTFILGFARRAAEYKRADLLLSDPSRLEEIARKAGRLQILYSGKAHPRDLGGKALIQRVHQAAEKLDPKLVQVVYLPNYNMELGLLLTAGVDVWLNTPLKPLEASGTSGMKAAINGVPSLSTLDGWWVEGCFEGTTGWEIEDDRFARPDERPTSVSPVASSSLYEKLEKEILPLYYTNKKRWEEIMRDSIAINGSFFNTHRMVQQYLWMGYSSVPLRQ